MNPVLSPPYPKKKRSSRLFDELRTNNDLLIHRIDQVERQMVENRQEVREQFARVDAKVDKSSSELTARLSWQTNFLGVMIASMSLIIIVAISILGWVMKH